jgi:hypothetical protein
MSSKTACRLVIILAGVKSSPTGQMTFEEAKGAHIPRGASSWVMNLHGSIALNLVHILAGMNRDDSSGRIVSGDDQHGA